MSEGTVTSVEELKADATAVDEKSDLENQNDKLRENNEALGNSHAALEQRVIAMEALITQQVEDGVYVGPEPALHHDPFDLETNPLHIKKHPDGKVLSWINPNIRNGSRGWRGWVPVNYDDEYGSKIEEYLSDPPAKMEGTATQDNYVRRGTDSILCWIEEEIYLARQEKRERKALYKQLAAQNLRNVTIMKGVETFGDGVTVEQTLPGGFKARKGATPLVSKHPSSRTEMFEDQE